MLSLDYAGTAVEERQREPKSDVISDIVGGPHPTFLRHFTGEKLGLTPRLKLQTERTPEEENKEGRALTSIPLSFLKETMPEKSTYVGPSDYSSHVSHSRTMLDPDAQHILRVHLAKQVLLSLREIQPYCHTPRAAFYANNLFRNIRTMRDLLPFDPYLELALALHDALAYENNWANYNASQYQAMYQVLKNLLHQKHLPSRKVEKAIVELETLGLNTTPFSLEFEDNESTPED